MENISKYEMFYTRIKILSYIVAKDSQCEQRWVFMEGEELDSNGDEELAETT